MGGVAGDLRQAREFPGVDDWHGRPRLAGPRMAGQLGPGLSPSVDVAVLTMMCSEIQANTKGGEKQ